MDKILFLWDKLVWLLNQVNKEVEITGIQVIVDYWIVFTIVGIIVYAVRLGMYSLYELFNYYKSKETKNLIKIRWQIEFKIFSEKIYSLFKLYKVNRFYYDSNEFRNSRKYTPSGIFELLLSIVKKMIPINIYNVFIWVVVFIYKYPMLVSEIYKIINVETLKNIISDIKSVGLNKFTESLKNIAFIMMAVLIMTGIWPYISTYKKVNNDKLEKVFANHDRLTDIISGILIKLEENIDTFFCMKASLNIFLCEYITHTDAYNFENKKLITVNNYKVKFEYGESEYIEQKLYAFNSYEEEFVGLNEIIQGVEKDYLWRTMRKVYKSILFEETKLKIISKIPFGLKRAYLLDKEYIKEWMTKASNKLLEEKFGKIIKVKNGSMTEEEYENEEGDGIKVSFEDSKQFYEEQLEKKLIEFSDMIDTRLRYSMEVYVLLEKYLYKLEKLNYRLDIISKIK